MTNLKTDIAGDVAAVERLSIVPAILEIICRTTGMGFAAIARVTSEQWVACGVRDEIKFGLVPGGELKLDTTICHEIRQSGTAVIIDHVEKDPIFAHHHTPAMYGFQSYISVPIIRPNGYFFGTLCAIDPRPSILNTPEIIGMFRVYAELISVHLNAVERLPLAEMQQVEDLITPALQAHLAKIAEIKNKEIESVQKSFNSRSSEFIQLINDATERVKVLLTNMKGYTA